MEYHSMYEELAIFELSIWLGLSAWIANAIPVIGGGGRPIDGGRCFSDGQRILGDGKTIRGFVVGVCFGTLTGIAQYLAAPHLRPILSQYVTLNSYILLKITERGTGKEYSWQPKIGQISPV